MVMGEKSGAGKMVPPNFRNYQRLTDISWWMGIPQRHKIPSFFPNSFSPYIAIYKEVRIS